MRILACFLAAALADPFLWLEPPEDHAARAWAKARTAEAVAALGTDPRFPAFRRAALETLGTGEAPDFPVLRGEAVYRFSQSIENPRGLWQVTDTGRYASRTPAWRTLIDLDALAKAEGQDWRWQGSTCLGPAYRRCLVRLTPGGDRSVWREFDVASGTFVEGGFHFGPDLADLAWADQDTVLLAAASGTKERAATGYPRAVRLWTRRTDPFMAAPVIQGDTVSGVNVASFLSEARKFLIVTAVTEAHSSQTYLLRDGAAVLLPVDGGADFQTVTGPHAIFALRRAWPPYPAGALIALDLAAFEASGDVRVTLVAEPSGREAFEGVVPFAGSGRAVFSTEGFLTPPALYWSEDAGVGLSLTGQGPALFQAGGLAVSSFEARSADGTPVPYFLVVPDGANGPIPLILSAYGGFGVSSVPVYDPVLGRLWLARGGAYVLAQVRGGGEFGPSWHADGTGPFGARTMEDLEAVARDLIRQGVTTHEKLGLQGASNGGLLMLSVMTREPGLAAAVHAAVPVADMLRFPFMGAGAAYIPDYGDPSDPHDRAFLEAQSPYAQLKPGVSYPPPLLTTLTLDDRVGPGHARKFAARMLALGQSVFFHEAESGGHDSSGLEGDALEAALAYTYFSQRLGLD
jgi:prolyl oligopeptidase